LWGGTDGQATSNGARGGELVEEYAEGLSGEKEVHVVEALNHDSLDLLVVDVNKFSIDDELLLRVS
jgi:hypothetical protein